MGIKISAEVLKNAKLSEQDFLIEIAVHLYNIGRLTMGQARKFANLDQISFQKEMSKRDVYIKYGIEDLEDDLNTIQYINSKNE